MELGDELMNHWSHLRGLKNILQNGKQTFSSSRCCSVCILSFFSPPHSWRGAIIEADQATEPPPSDDDKDAAPPAPANPGKTVPPEGQY